MATLAVAFALPLTVIALDAAPVGACSCASNDTGGPIVYRPDDAVFVGRIIDHDKPWQIFSSIDKAVWTFAVRAVYHGKVNETQQVVSAVESASCGLVLPDHGTFLVFASTHGNGIGPEPGPGQVAAGLCGGVTAVGDQPVDPRLGTPHPPPPGTGSIPSSALARALPRLAIGATGFGVVVTVVVFLRRRRATS